MLSKYYFREQYTENSFRDDSSSGMIYFPITDAEDFPSAIRNKAEEMIDDLISAYEKENKCVLDLLTLRLNARIEVYFNQKNIPVSNISVIISNDYGDDELWINKDVEIKHGDILYEPFKKYFLQQLESILFPLCN